jgi:hypothetical protein
LRGPEQKFIQRIPDVGQRHEKGEGNEERYFIDSTNGFRISLVFRLRHYASDISGL